MDLVGPILDFVKSIWTSSAKCVKYHRGLNEKMKMLEDKLKELNARKSDIESETIQDLHPGQTVKQAVVIWLQKVQEFNDDKHLQQKFEKVKFLSRACLGRQVAKKIEEMDKHLEKGSFSEGLMVDAAPGRGETLLTTALVGETAAVKMEEIWNSLVSDDVQRIGVYGMGGSGKTTIMKRIHNQILESDKFDHVYWIAVSKATSVTKLQDGIARALGFNGLEETEDEAIRASTLSRKLQEKKRCVLIFDDMWEHFNLEEVGIPETTVGFRCKLMLTSRLLDVCRKMSSRCIKMELLSDNEAWDLFLDKVGRDIFMTSEVKTTAKLVAKECARLPLAIIAVGTSMKGVDDKHEWRNTLNKLRDSTKGLVEMEKVIKQLTVSYDRLEDEKAQRCLLYCALYPEDYVIERHKLIPLLIAEELTEGMESSWEEGFDEWHTILNKLENACLLESCTDYVYGIRRKCVKMHDVIRDMALQIMGDKSMVEAGVRLSEFPSKEKWTEVLEAVSLMDNNIEEIPVDASPRCSKLKTLRLSDSRWLKMIPDSFFVHMPSLSVLDLSCSSIKKLPKSISDLENLTALMLRDCHNLYYVPSLAKLRRLRMLDLYRTIIEEVPEGMEMLANLQYLNLYIEGLKTFPTGILPKLTRLQCLILYCGSETLYIKGEELIGLKKLERLECKFYDPNDFNLYVRSLEHHQRRLPKSYRLYVGSWSLFDDRFYVDDDGKHKKIVGYNSNRREGEAESKPEESILLLQNDVEELCIEECDDVRSLSDVRVQLLSNLEVLELVRLKNLCAASSHSPLLLHCTFSCLRELHIVDCRNIKRLFTPGLVPHLQNLELIYVLDCEGLEEIVAEEEEEGMIKNDHNFSITLPKLRALCLIGLPELKCIMCRRGVMVCDSIQTIEINGCPKVKRLPLKLPLNLDGQPSPPPLLTYIEFGCYEDENWWNLLEWDNPIAKDVLQPFIKIPKFLC